MLARFKHLNVFLKDPDKKSPGKIVLECLQFAIHKKTMPTDYFRKFLYRKGVNNINNYISHKEYNAILSSNKLFFPEVSALLKNKLCFHLICEKYGIKTPQLKSYNFKNSFYHDNKEETVHNLDQLVAFFEKVFKLDDDNSLFLKPVDGIGGRGCFILHKDNLKNQLLKIEKELFSNCYLHQKYVIQHPDINKIHAKSINTMRIVTYIDKLQTIQILSVLMRFGVGDSITDNIGTGGFFINVNATIGELEGVGMQDVVTGGRVFSVHPDTKQPLEGFKIPFFKEACTLVMEANRYFPSRIVGWDVAITTTGPIIIEANHNPSLQISDVAFGGYGKHSYFKEILNEIS